jgi:DNA-3-methyladenine glycosylase
MPSLSAVRNSLILCPAFERAKIGDNNPILCTFHSMPALEKLRHPFFRQPASGLARDLIGTILVRRVRGRILRARIVETEAYVGAHDKACHAYKGRTQRTEVMFGPAGRAYVYLIYGIYDMFNIVAGEIDDPQAVLIRGAVPLDGWQADLSGPGKLARALKIRRVHTGLDLTGKNLFLQSDAASPPKIATTARIGIDYAEEWKDAPLRFLDVSSLRPPASRGRKSPGGVPSIRSPFASSNSALIPNNR